MASVEVGDALEAWLRERELATVRWEGRGDGILKRHGSDIVGVGSEDDLSTRFEMVRSDRDFLIALDMANMKIIARLAASLLGE